MFSKDVVCVDILRPTPLVCFWESHLRVAHKWPFVFDTAGCQTILGSGLDRRAGEEGYDSNERERSVYNPPLRKTAYPLKLISSDPRDYFTPGRYPDVWSGEILK